MLRNMSYFAMLLLALALFACGEVKSDSTKPASSSPSQDKQPDGTPDDFEVRQTEKLLGVPLQTFPEPQGTTKFDELPAARAALQFTATQQPATGPTPQAWYETRSIVKATGPDGSVYEAYSTANTSNVIRESNQRSTAENTRQPYGSHHGYGYVPQDIYIGKRVGGSLRTSLFFPDDGSHTTAPHSLAIDNKGMVHLIVADVNIFQENRLDLYWVIGDPSARKWTSAWLVDRRMSTSSSHPWSGAWADKVELLWTWDIMGNDESPDDGIFHLQWQPSGFGQKIRLLKAKFTNWDAAIDHQTGSLLLVYSDEKGVFVMARRADGTWTMPAKLHKSLTQAAYVSASCMSEGTFIIRTTFYETHEWLVRLL